MASLAEKAKARDWPVHELATGYLALLTAPQELAVLLVEMAGA